MDQDFTETLRELVGRRYVHTSSARLARFCKGWRTGGGEAEAAVEPGSLVELWRVVQACVDNNRIVITQAANTGLTEGSTPKDDYDRPVVVINTLRLDKIQLLRNGHQIISHPGATLYKLEQILKPLDRDPHSVIGATSIGASIIGGVCNNSGGSLTQRGPAYTELALFAQVGSDGVLRLINHLGIELGDTPEEILGRLDRHEFTEADVRDDVGRARDDGYPEKVRDFSASTPSRYNADPDRLFETSGSAGKLVVFAVRLDTYPTIQDERVYYLGTDDPSDLTVLRKRMFAEIDELPISGEYLHRDMFDVAHRYGKDTLLLIHWLGTDWLPFIFKWKTRIDAVLNRALFLPKHFVDRTMQGLSRLLPEALPKSMLTWRDRFEHHLILKVSGQIAEQVEGLLNEIVGEDAWFLCTAPEAKKAGLHRFAAAGSSVRYGMCHSNEVEGILSLDIALPRNTERWFEDLPPEIEKDIQLKLYCGHFFCHVFHNDYAIRKGADPKAVKSKLLALLDKQGAEYPAEHNVGHLYKAKPALESFYDALDPTNSFNPGIGKTSKSHRAPGASDKDTLKTSA